MNFEPMNFITNLPYMVKGMLGIAVVILIIRVLIKDKKAGRSGCGAGCAGCAMHGSCHSKCAPDGKRK